MTPLMRRARFLAVFFLLLVLFEIPLFLRPVDERVVRPFTSGIAWATGIVLNGFGQQVQVSGTTIVGKCFAVDLKNGCNAIEATLFLMAAVLAFPAVTVRQRLGVALAGAGILQLANFVRVTSLYLLGCYRRSWFEIFHLAVWQSIIFALAVAMFVVWTARVTALLPAARGEGARRADEGT
jgi:exosortase/archaeosortase family protein